MSIATVLEFILNHSDYPLLLFAIIPAIALLAYFSFKDYVILKDQSDEDLKKRKKMKLLVFISRSIIITLLIIAFAYPFQEVTESIPGSPKVKLLVDNSSSMVIYPQGIAENLKEALEEQIPVEISNIGGEEHSPLGDDILSQIREDDNVLLITDGHVTEGTSMGDVALYANTINVTLNAIKLEAEQYDGAVRIIGPEKVTANSENNYAIRLSQTREGPVKLRVQVDGETVFDEQTEAEEVLIKDVFTDGYHTFYAKISSADHFDQNNEYYKTVKVVPKPRVLLVTQRESPLSKLFEPVYELDIAGTLPENLEPYTAIILNDLPASQIDRRVTRIIDYVVEGNGLAVIGGDNSYDVGNYKGSRFEQILPVFIAQPGKKKGDINIVLVIDISGSTGSKFGDSAAVDVEKALALGVLDDLSLLNRVGVVAFNTEAYVLGEVEPLVEHTELRDNIARLEDSGGTNIGVGILKAVELLQNKGGSKNIILISDGKTQNGDQALDAVKFASSQGIRVYTVGVGAGTNENNLQTYAQLSNAAYFAPNFKDRLKILFGDVESSGQKRVLPYVYVDPTHFIPSGLEPKGNIYGYNVVTPKNTAKLLATTDVGDPLLVVSRFGLGRIASLATDDGTLYAPELLNEDNSRIYTRLTNWVIGDPERKNNRFIQISDGREGETLDILIKDPEEPKIDDISLIKIDEDLWSGSKLEEGTGFKTLGTAQYSVNYLKEYERVGQNEELEQLVGVTGGRIFEKEEIDQIVEHVRARSRRQILQKKSYSWIFVLIALFIFLVEVCSRRIIRNFYK